MSVLGGVAWIVLTLAALYGASDVRDSVWGIRRFKLAMIVRMALILAVLPEGLVVQHYLALNMGLPRVTYRGKTLVALGRY